ncbi:ribonuclease E inhibitor RraB [Chitinivorax sp. B]|uniref:ribonuclease E inhibitor RraB n=1 Tax=Chitinivorax sp. B TaxID=2502235 RepID=UPI0010F88C05|nr:ribonuclease E inhibitor RraB [Chitinivorax sp. B]
MIELRQLEAMFDNVRANTDWNMDGLMMWGYFFTDRSEEKLEAIIPVLMKLGYRYVDLYIPELEDDQEPFFFLHVEKEDIHSPATLHERNLQFYALAEEYGLDSYDGMDVGPVQRH